MAGTYTINVDQGSTWNLSLTYVDSNGAAVNLSGYTARMQVRPSLESATTTASLTTENGGIAITAATGGIALTLSATATAAITAATYVYDVEIVTGATVTRILEGDFVVRREVTR